MGRASALVELCRYDEALTAAAQAGETGEKGRTAQAALAMGPPTKAWGAIRSRQRPMSGRRRALPGWSDRPLRRLPGHTGRTDEGQGDAGRYQPPS